MIMHYLGLDHIGHKAGPLSPNMVPKQEEMDGIVRQIYQAMTSMDHLSNTLLVLCGDHGMNEGGNHGGSAPGETSPALVFISPKFKSLSKGKPCPTEPRRDYEYYSLVEQSDVAPTLASLLGVPIPLNNLGVMISDVLPLWSRKCYRYLCPQHIADEHHRHQSSPNPAPKCETNAEDRRSNIH
jgi:ethanolaminephosphotransferase